MEFGLKRLNPGRHGESVSLLDARPSWETHLRATGALLDSAGRSRSGLDRIRRYREEELCVATGRLGSRGPHPATRNAHATKKRIAAVLSRVIVRPSFRDMRMAGKISLRAERV
jgi:hypothetical protein